MTDDRTRKILIISKRLLIFAGISLLLTSILFGITLYFQERLMVSWLVFECGIIGGFVSIQQRLKQIDTEELGLLSESWATILVVPIYGGIFALVLYVLFISGLIQGHLFPKFYIPEFSTPPVTQDIIDLLSKTYPAQGSDLAKLIFWSFVSGFSERFVPQIIHKVSRSVEENPK